MSYVFKTDGLTRRFSGFTAVNNVSIEIPEGGVRTIIGPNGAGKTTFFNLLSGLLPPSEGRIFFRDRDITALHAYQRARLGIARSFQITNIFGHLTVGENVRLAAQAVHDGKANFFFPGSRMDQVNETTERVLHDVGLWDARDARAENLSHGDQRRLEIGLVIASDPPMLLLDEPLAGMSPTETHETVDLIQRISPGRTILLVEHDIDVVMSISTTITVLQTGQILATGTPAEIRGNEAVQRAYLGELV
ncbi:ABC transporter ATP-binding protein [Vulcanimicrobium alpinum]|uniref:ABC transporter ATP-binding protein n=2 Tax=Vulcanimicrobium alpinum TaxID=3016050 RepID=A0AAN1XXC1_UNVUL|nr:ABC transporter ATP-binding protein [Vulcanimicrobium alpinum]BDE06083.1 ABC transporter ATP-binding protein [Vulcanimicrobium alpinum]